MCFLSDCIREICISVYIFFIYRVVRFHSCDSVVACNIDRSLTFSIIPFEGCHIFILNVLYIRYFRSSNDKKIFWFHFVVVERYVNVFILYIYVYYMSFTKFEKSFKIKINTIYLLWIYSLRSEAHGHRFINFLCQCANTVVKHWFLSNILSNSFRSCCCTFFFHRNLRNQYSLYDFPLCRYSTYNTRGII